MFCVYVTEYLGEQKIPKYYVGSSSVKNINEGYKGSVTSKKWKHFWNKEPSKNFKVTIISKHSTRLEALEKEYEYQKQNDVVKNPLWFNKSYAIKNGFFGRDVSGPNNPMYGSNRTGEKHKGGKNISAALKKYYKTEAGKKKRRRSKKLWTEKNPSIDEHIKNKIKNTWKKTGRNLGEKNGMYNKKSPMNGKKLYNNGIETKAFFEGSQPDNWILGRLKKE